MIFEQSSVRFGLAMCVSLLLPHLPSSAPSPPTRSTFGSAVQSTTLSILLLLCHYMMLLCTLLCIIMLVRLLNHAIILLGAAGGCQDHGLDVSVLFVLCLSPSQFALHDWHCARFPVWCFAAGLNGVRLFEVGTHTMGCYRILARNLIYDCGMFWGRETDINNNTSFRDALNLFSKLGLAGDSGAHPEDCRRRRPCRRPGVCIIIIIIIIYTHILYIYIYTLHIHIIHTMATMSAAWWMLKN